MQQLNQEIIRKLKPGVSFPTVERVIQFGEGNFLRAFVDWMIHQANQAGVFDGSVLVVQPIAQGLAHMLNDQQGLYTVVLRGIEGGEEKVREEVVTAISRALDSTTQWEQVLAAAAKPEIDILISNTTEAGIAYRAEDRLSDTPPVSFPGKVCAYLYHRYQAFQGDPTKGMLLIPCELIERNGDKLREIVLHLAADWGLPAEFMAWVTEANYFLNTLVDRIVTGYPGQEEAVKLCEGYGYEDRLLVTGEIFHLWVIEGPEELKERFPLHKAGLNVKWVRDLTPYRTRKVRILNGLHTSTVPVAYLAGITTVREAVEHPVIGCYMNHLGFAEIIPTLDLAHEELVEFAGQVVERFKNPFIYHRWLDISLNSISKYKARVLPSLQAHLTTGQVPDLLSLALAALIRFYRGEALTEKGMVARRDGEEYLVRDDRDVLEFFYTVWQKHGANLPELAAEVLRQQSFWGEDLSRYPGLTEKIARDLAEIEAAGIGAVVAGRLN